MPITADMQKATQGTVPALVIWVLSRFNKQINLRAGGIRGLALHKVDSIWYTTPHMVPLSLAGVSSEHKNKQKDRGESCFCVDLFSKSCFIFHSGVLLYPIWGPEDSVSLILGQCQRSVSFPFLEAGLETTSLARTPPPHPQPSLQPGLRAKQGLSGPCIV